MDGRIRLRWGLILLTTMLALFVIQLGGGSSSQDVAFWVRGRLPQSGLMQLEPTLAPLVLVRPLQEAEGGVDWQLGEVVHCEPRLHAVAISGHAEPETKSGWIRLMRCGGRDYIVQAIYWHGVWRDTQIAHRE